MADEPEAMRDRPDGATLEVGDWCIALNKQTLQRLEQAGCGAMFSAVGYLDEEGKAIIFVLAAGREHAATKFLVERAAMAVQAYVQIGDPKRTGPDGESVN